MLGKQAIAPSPLIITDNLQLAQQVIINKSGYILESDDTLFNFSPVANTKVVALFDFLCIIYDEILEIELGKDDLFFPKINIEFNGKKGLFNFRFCKMCYQHEIAILWTITPFPQDVAYDKYQQKHHEEAMMLEQNSFLRK